MLALAVAHRGDGNATIGKRIIFAVGADDERLVAFLVATDD